MTWTSVGTIPIGVNWSFTDTLEGEFFRITLSGNSAGSSYYLAQVAVNDDGKDLFDIRVVDNFGGRQILHLSKPNYVSKRQIALKQVPQPVPIESELRRVISTLFLQPARSAYTPVQRANWMAQIEVSDISSAPQSGIKAPEIVAALQANFDNIAQQIKNIPTPPSPVDNTFKIIAALQPNFDNILQQISRIAQASNQSTAPSGSSSNTPSPSGTSKVLTYVSDGDQNGVFYWIGTNYGTEAWSNPVTNNRIQIILSNPYYQSSSSDVLAATSDVGNCFAEQVNGVATVTIYLGDKNSLTCNYYSIQTRTDYNGNHARDWKFKGSNDDVTWTDLDTQINNQTLDNYGKWLSLPVNTNTNFKYFQFACTRDSSGAPQICLARMELYGTLYHTT